MSFYSGLSRWNYVQCDRLVSFTISEKSLFKYKQNRRLKEEDHRFDVPPEIHKLNYKSQSQCNQVLYSTYKTLETFLICTLSQVCSVILHCDRMFSSIKSGCLHNVLSKLKMNCKCRVECG